jgi:hypothetical protein
VLNFLFLYNETAAHKKKHQANNISNKKSNSMFAKLYSLYFPCVLHFIPFNGFLMLNNGIAAHK